MPERFSTIETLDLRFRATPQKKNWLPGGAWLWFVIGVAAGIAGWIYGQRELSSHLIKQVSANNTAPSALYAMEALEQIDPASTAHLVSALEHSDIRVAKSAYQKIILHLDQLSNSDIVELHALMRTVAERLGRLPPSLPPGNLNLVRSLAARLYSDCISHDDPQTQPIAQQCQRLLNLGRPPELSTESTGLAQSPPRPLPPESVANPAVKPVPTAQRESESIHLSSSNPTASLRLVTGQTRPRESTEKGTEAKPAASARLSDITEPIADNAPTEGVSISLNDLGDNTAESVAGRLSDRDKPIVVATPASIATQPLAQMKLVSHQANLAGIERLSFAELVKLLAHENADTAKAAALALRHRGMSDERIEMASDLATASAQRRLALIQQIANSGDLEPRPWLLWMAEDGQPEVRRMAISLLVPIADQAVLRAFRNLLAQEKDQQIRELLTRALMNPAG
jgi:HEAT repeats